MDMENQMDYQRLGETDLLVSRIGYGASGLGNMYTPVEDDEANRGVAMAIEEYGINYFDAAPSYGVEGLSETRLGAALEGHRHKVVLTTKFGRYDHKGDGTFEFNYEPKRVRLELENSLRRLRTDYVDVYQGHDIIAAPSAEYLIQETMPELEKLKKEGKIRYIGVTGQAIERMKAVADGSGIVDVMLTYGLYSLRQQTLETKLDWLTEKKRYGIVNSSITFLGFMTKGGKGVINFFEGEMKQALIAAQEEASALCEAAGTDLGTLAVKFGLNCEHCADSTLVAMARVARLKQNMELYASRKDYDPELAEKVKKIMAKTIRMF